MVAARGKSWSNEPPTAEDQKKAKSGGIDVDRGETVLLVARPSIAAVWYR
jgi:hypothetical protein